MGFDLEALRDAVTKHGRVARVVIADVKGSSPRETGAAMLVWENGQSGSIGGGALEFELAKRALQVSETKLSSHALGPELGQCCGGAVQILTEVFDARNLPVSQDGVFVRGVNALGVMPLSVSRLLTKARSAGVSPETQLINGWFVEPVAVPTRQLWIWGAGHVGRAMVDAYSPLPEFAITWVDTSMSRFPESPPSGVSCVSAPDPSQLVKHAPSASEHLILTYSHALDLELCHHLLKRGFAFAGLIGSKSKWARFRTRLAALGHSSEQILRITCPIGDPSLGKHPQAIAISVGASLLACPDALAQTQRTTA